MRWDKANAKLMINTAFTQRKFEQILYCFKSIKFRLGKKDQGFKKYILIWWLVIKSVMFSYSLPRVSTFINLTQADPPGISAAADVYSANLLSATFSVSTINTMRLPSGAQSPHALLLLFIRHQPHKPV